MEPIVPHVFLWTGLDRETTSAAALGWPKLEENSDFAITGFRGKPDRGGGRGADAHREPAMSCDQMYHLSIHEYLSYS